jgi:hypothetical protein
MHYRDNAYLVREFTAGMKTQYLKSDTLAISKDGLPRSIEIRVLQHHGISVME